MIKLMQCFSNLLPKNEEKPFWMLFQVRFFSIQANGTTDKGNIKEEMFHVVYCDFQSSDMKVQAHSRFLAVRQPTNANAAGLFECFKKQWNMSRSQKLIGKQS